MVEIEDKAHRKRMPDGMRRALAAALHTVFPPRCICCGDAVGSDHGMCSPCWQEASFITGTVCDCCGAPLPGESATIELCDECLSEPRPWDRGRAAFLYAGTGRKLVLAFKHADRLDLVPPLGEMLARAARPLIEPGMVIAPVPLHRMRMVRRMFNQSALLAQTMSKHTRLPCVVDLFDRRRATPSQEGLSRAERHQNVQDAIRLRPKYAAKIKGRHVLVVDDVLTSGATMAACAEAARAAGARQVSVAALARVAKDA
ncbi:ComF family protein [Rhodobacter aestuarii]|uniref:ComF family protein n=1 Tax=Rhodobacter aestuarii TaxID=453582 RepID=A0A1N7Q8E5_9RHOB|nr:ComF family protein [Rhodobacter aestuarii]PTV93734.1 ComF family protein [Rhodobacter aestuarii]SIT19123.1 comF family protein [Rhodobacter aestuarii]